MKSSKNIAFFVLFQMLFFATTANATFLRFWRGFPKSEVSVEQFEDGLNQIFLPATAALAKTPAHLISYQPLLMPTELLQNENFPIELALVEYASEAEYRAYRDTVQGQAYSNLHWDYFDKSASKSTVPISFQGTLENDKAYLIGTDIDWNAGPTFFYVFPNDEETQRILPRDLVALQRNGFKGVVLSGPTYVMIYAKSFLTPALSRRLLWETKLRRGTTLSYGSGVQYPL